MEEDEHSLDSRNERLAKIVEYVAARLKEGSKLTATQIEKSHLSALKMGRDHVRMAIDMAVERGLLVVTDLPDGERHGGRKAYLRPVELELI
jgi:hypothetical protein